MIPASSQLDVTKRKGGGLRGPRRCVLADTVAVGIAEASHVLSSALYDNRQLLGTRIVEGNVPAPDDK